MRRVIEGVVYNFLQRSGNEYFTNEVADNEKLKKLSNYQIIALIVSLIISQLILLLIGKWLWNSFLVPAVDNINALSSVWQLLGISLLLKLLIN